MSYNNLISRTDGAALVPEHVVDSMLVDLSTQSVARQLFTNIFVPTSQTRFPVLSALPVAYWVNGDTGLKQTTEVNWANKYLDIQEIAAIIPIPDAVLEDTAMPIWDRVQPLMVQAIGRVLDAAIFFGTNAPAIFPTYIASAATSAGNNYAKGTNAQAAGGVAEDINQLIAKVEADGYPVTALVGDLTFRSVLRTARDTTGQKLLDVGNNTVEGIDLTYAMPGLWGTSTGNPQLFALDARQFILGIRRDITFMIAKEGVVTDSQGAIIYNLLQQDMQAMRVTFRAGWQVSNPINYMQQTEASRYPAAVLTHA